MSHPPYHLRSQKMVDRFLLLETLRRLRDECGLVLSDYTYYGFGGPFLEDFKLIHSHIPGIRLVSFERDQETYRRQEFHRFCSSLDLRIGDFEQFLAEHDYDGSEIFWLDYTDLKLCRLHELANLLRNCLAGTVVKITLRAKIDNYAFADQDSLRELLASVMLDEGDMFTAESAISDEILQRFIDEFSEFLLPDTDDIRAQLIPGKMPALIQQMVRMASDQSLSDLVFQPLTSARYQEPTPMVTVTGIVCTPEDAMRYRKQLKTWKLANLNWEAPRKLAVPDLSIKERLCLERHLPLDSDVGEFLACQLGYRLVGKTADNRRLLEQYSDFYNYYPMLTKVSPY